VGSDVPYSWREYFDWCESVGANYAALPDFACEPGLHLSSVWDRVYHTVLSHVEALWVYDRHDYSFTPLPVLQGWDPEDYRLCARWFRSQGLVREYMAIGTVCKRKGTDEICDVLSVLETELPNTEFHLFGATLNAWKDDRLAGRFRSSDTAAWNWGASDTEDKKRLYREYREKVENTRRDYRQSTLS